MIVIGLASVALVVAWWLTKMLCAPGSRFSLDHPNERSLHQVPTPRTGGLAILGSVGAGLTLVALFAVPMTEWRTDVASARPSLTFWILCMTTMLSIVSFLDDRMGLPVGVRFGVHLLAAVGVVAGAGLTIQSLGLPVLGSAPLAWAAAPVTIVFLLWMTNLYNFMDGMDGFAGGMTVVGYGFLAYFAWTGQHPFIMILSLLIAMGTAGFLFYNLPPARIFMGDVGSVPVGFLTGILITLGIRDGLFDMWVPLLLFSPFILDATATVLRRAWQGDKPWEAHRTHYYQRLVLHGWGHRKTVFAEYGLMLFCGLAAVVYHQAGEPWRLVVLAIWIVVFAGLAMGVRLVEQRLDRRIQES